MVAQAGDADYQLASGWQGDGHWMVSPTSRDMTPKTKKRQTELPFAIWLVTPPGQRAKWAEIPVELIALSPKSGFCVRS